MTSPFFFFEYIVEAGDTYGSIAGMYRVDEGELKAFNKNAALTQGASIKIPSYNGGCTRGAFYTIKQTDTLYRISRRFGILINTLLCANPYFNPAYRFPGQIIIIPLTKKSLAFYTLGQDERLLDVLKRYDMDLSMFCALNKGADPLSMHEGQRITVRKKFGSLYRRYTMRPGDSILSVAARFGVSIENLLSANNEIMPGEFLPGAMLRIPLRPYGS